MEPRSERQGGRAPELAAGALERLRRQGGPELVRSLLDSFRARTPARLDQARAALEAGDGAAAARVFHSLRSSAALVGAEAIEEAAQAAERFASSGDLAAARNGAADLAALFERLRPQLMAPEAAGGPRAARRGRIALVEDNEDNRLLARVVLGERFTVEEYATGVEALAGIAHSRPDLVLLDVSLPGMDGLEVLAALRRIPDLGGLPVVALIAHAMPGDREHLFAAGFDDYVSKPILDPPGLMRRIERLLGDKP